MLSFSTCWNSSRHREGGPMLQEILDLGFDAVELSHGIRVSLVGGIQQYYDAGKVRISSLHNFCPLPLEVQGSSPDCYEFTSHRPFDQRRAVKLSCQTIDFAHRLGAGFVVLHLGRVAMSSVTRKLGELAKEGKMESREFVKLKIAAVKERESKGPAYLERVKACLMPIVEHAAKKNINLGIEGRFGYEEVPSELELPVLLDEIDAPHVGYWHDFGHIQVKENLEFLSHYEWLKFIRHRLFGCHLHDCTWPTGDHRVPFTGSIDYDRLIALLPENCLFVWELNPRATAEEIQLGLARWKEKFGAKTVAPDTAAAAQ
jgi:sugar phosphate isomerase/epimerase